MYAGAKQVIASLWKVDDRATAELMKYFYQNLLKNNQSPSNALRQAQLQMMKQPRWKSPYFWAAFVLQGDFK
jgi:CHAT domain-containing protein